MKPEGWKRAYPEKAFFETLFIIFNTVRAKAPNQLLSQDNSAAFREFAWRFTNIIGRALVVLGCRPDYGQIIRYLTYMPMSLCLW